MAHANFETFAPIILCNTIAADVVHLEILLIEQLQPSMNTKDHPVHMKQFLAAYVAKITHQNNAMQVL